MFPNLIQTAGAVDGASTCAKVVNMIHDQPQDEVSPFIISQVDFENAFHGN